MDKAAFLADMAEIIEVDDPSELTDDFALGADTNWDSMAVVATIAAIDEHFDVRVPGEALRNCGSIGELLQIIAGRVEG